MTATLIWVIINISFAGSAASDVGGGAQRPARVRVRAWPSATCRSVCEESGAEGDPSGCAVGVVDDVAPPAVGAAADDVGRGAAHVDLAAVACRAAHGPVDDEQG